MSRTKLYEGKFLSVGGVETLVRLWSTEATSATVGELTFSGESPAVVEYSDKSKLDVWQTSTLQLNVISPSDRLYTSLYTVNPLGVQVEVYRDNSLYWQGWLDPEVYSEPYERKSNYPVTLTFSDFAPLDDERYTIDNLLAYNGVNINSNTSVKEVLGYAAERLGLSSTIVSQTSMEYHDKNDQTYHNVFDTVSAPLSRLSGMTVYAAIEELLKPLSLSIRQEKGKFCVYDLNYLYSDAHDNDTAEQITWASDTQSLSFDTPYSAIDITYETDNDTSVSTWDEKMVPVDVEDPAVYKALSEPHYSMDSSYTVSYGGVYYHIYSIPEPVRLDNASGRQIGWKFSTNSLSYHLMWASVSQSQSGGCYGDGRPVFKIVKGKNGDDIEGVIAYAYKGYVDAGSLLYTRTDQSNLGDTQTSAVNNHTLVSKYSGVDPIGLEPFSDGSSTTSFTSILKTPEAPLPEYSPDTALIVKMKVAWDVRMDMFSESQGKNLSGVSSLTSFRHFASEIDLCNHYRNKIQVLRIPIRLVLTYRNTKRYYSNESLSFFNVSAYTRKDYAKFGSWSTTPSNCWLSFRRKSDDIDKRGDKDVIKTMNAGYPICDTGFCDNLQTYPLERYYDVYKYFGNNNEESMLDEPGEMILLPNDIPLSECSLHIEVDGANWLAAGFRKPQTIDRDGIPAADALNSVTRYALVTAPIIETVNLSKNTIIDYQPYDSVTHAELYAGAKDSTSIDIKFSSYAEEAPNAKGSYTVDTLNSSGVLRKISLDYARYVPISGENAIWGTIDTQIANNYFSQHGTLHSIIEGTAGITDPSVKVFTDAASPDKFFIPTSQVIDLALDTQDTKFVELTKLDFIDENELQNE